MKAFAALVLALLVVGTVQQASALRTTEVKASPLLLYPWMPWRDENGVWTAAAEPNPDFSKMTLSDLPPPELYLQVALTSPFAVPQVPLEKVINNTIANLNGAKLPKSAKDWVQMAGSAGSFVASNVQRALQLFFEPLPAQGVTVDTSKVLKALPQLMNITLVGMDPKWIGAVAEKLNIKLPAMSHELSSSLDDLKKLPTLLQLPKDGQITLTDLQRLPKMLQEVALTTANAAEAFSKQLQTMQVPKVLDDAGLKDLRSFVAKQINVDLPAKAPVEKVIVNITKSLPSIAKQLGIQIEGLEKIPSIVETLDNTFNQVKKSGLVVTNPAGGIDVGATISSLPAKVPQAVVQNAVSGLVPRMGGDAADVKESIEQLQKSVNRLGNMAATIMSVPRRIAAQIN